MSDARLANYRKQGFLHLRGFFGRPEVEAIRQDAIRTFQNQLRHHGGAQEKHLGEPSFEHALVRLFQDDLPRFVNTGKQIQHLVSLHRLSLNLRVLKLLRQLGLVEPNVSTRPVLYFNSPQLATKEIYWKVFAHQDWRSMQGSLNSVVAWLPLHDINRQLGALEVVPGSHCRGLLATEVVDHLGKVHGFADSDFHPIEVEQGDLLVFSSFLVHRSGTNSSGRIRWACHFRYNDLAESTFIERGYPHAYVYQPVDELMTPGFPSVAQVVHAFEDRTVCTGREAA